MPRGLKPSTMKAAHAYESFRSLVWIIVFAIIAMIGYMLYSGKSPADLANEVTNAVEANE
jgi:hypothetical protein